MLSEVFVSKFAEAIAIEEGFYVVGSVAQRNNNPGNLRSWGAYPIVDGYAKFPTVDHGWISLRRQIRRNIARGLTTYEFFAGKPGVYAGYSPAEDSNRPKEYAEFVASKMGIDPAARLYTVSEVET